jgi:molecular chaperone DnaK (HSP70)
MSGFSISLKELLKDLPEEADRIKAVLSVAESAALRWHIEKLQIRVAKLEKLVNELLEQVQKQTEERLQ